jgi:hypothetical protein
MLNDNHLSNLLERDDVKLIKRSGFSVTKKGQRLKIK